MRRLSWLVTTGSLISFCLVLFARHGSCAERVCPGNVASITPRFVQHTLIVIPVKINGKGPFDFLVDTGSQITVIDPALAIQLMLNYEGTIGVTTAAGRVSAPLEEVASIEADFHIVEKTPVLIQSLGQFQALKPHISGLLGENFLAHFDVFIDYRHKMLCIDDTKQMGRSMRGERISLVDPHDSEGDLPLAPRLVIPVQVSNAKGRRLFLQIDSGTDAPMLFGALPEIPRWMRKGLPHKAHLAGTEEQVFELLPPRDVRIGNRTLRQVAFVTPVGNGSKYLEKLQDGLLPTVLFQSVFISFADRWVVFNPE